MISLKQLAGGVATAALTMSIAGSAMAQQTSSTLAGTVIGANGAIIDGASVTVVHTPTGSASRLTSNAAGRFFQSGLRVGGPYTITIQAAGYEAQVLENIFLRVGQVESLRANLSAIGEDVDVIVVRGTAPQQAITISNGMGSVFNSEDLSNQPSLNRDITGAVLRDPFVSVSTDISERAQASGTFSIAGSDPRLNGFVIDGLPQQNDFGLDSGLFPTLRQPVSLDTVESVSVAASDYTVLATGFQGGLVNIVTKSGTNNFDGGAYYYFRDDSMVGSTAFDQPVTASGFTEKEYGAYVGGPIVKDKLFFFANYEKFEKAEPQVFDYGNVDPEMFNVIRGIMQNVYNYDPGQKGNTSADEGAERYLAKVDWNINDSHRATFKYQHSEDNLLSNARTFNFPTNYYDLSSNQDVFTTELFSDWNENFSTILRVSHKDYTRGQDSLGDTSATGVGFGAFVIEGIDASDPYFAANGLDGNALMGGSSVDFELGPDVFRHANAYDDSRTQVNFQGDYTYNNHAITFGGQWEQFELSNLFGMFSKGEYNFSSLQALADQDAFVVYSNTQTNNALDALVNWGYTKIALFAEDEFAISPNVTINYGVRYERFGQSDTPPAPEQVSNGTGTALLNFQDVYGISGQDNLDGLDIIQPRFGFSYDHSDRLSINGGFGLFSGSDPQVWVSNNFTPLQLFAVGFDTNVTGLNVPPSIQNTVGVGVAPRGAVQNVDVIDPNFEIPGTWRASLKADYQLDLSRFGMGDDYFVSAGILYGKAVSPISWRNLAFDRPDLAGSVGIAPDGRPIYPDLTDIPDQSDPNNQDGTPATNGGEFSLPDAFMITNGSGGQNYSIALRAAKEYDNGVGFDVSYTWTQAEDPMEFSSSRAVSSWRGIVASDRQNPVVSTSSNQIEHKIGMNFSYARSFWDDMESRFDVFAFVQSGRPFSYGFDVGSSNPLFGRANGGGPRDGADLLYIPTMSGGAFNDPSVNFVSAQDEADFLAFVVERGLDKYAGGIVPRNSDESDWSNRWDFRFQQELPGAFGQGRLEGNRFKFVLDIQNFPNLINDSWGRQVVGPRFGRAAPIRASLVHAATGEVLSDNEPGEFCKAATDCTYLYDYNSFGADVERELTTASLYKVRVGLRYEF